MIRLRIVLLMLLAFPALGGSKHYIRAGASGANNGSSWNDAWPTFAAAQAATYQRDDVYYFAGTPFNENVTCNRPASGALWIRFEHANMESNSLDAGWSDTYTNQTVINGWLSLAGGWIEWDGITLSETNGAGCKIVMQPGSSQSSILLGANQGPYHLLHNELLGLGYHLATNTLDGININNATIDQKGIVIATNWIHEFNRNGITVGGIAGTSYADPGISILGNWITECGSTEPTVHSQGVQMSFAGNALWVIGSGNMMRNCTGTAFVANLGSATAGTLAIHNHHRWVNNICWKTDNGVYDGDSPAMLFWSERADTGSDIVVANNSGFSIGDLSHTDSLSQTVNSATNRVANFLLNELMGTCYFSATNQGFANSTGGAEATNGYFSCVGAGVPSGTQGQVGGGIYPFVDAPNGDFHLVAGCAAIGAAMDLSTVFTNDFYGRTRVPGQWDLGAVAFTYVGSGGGGGGGGSQPPGANTAVRAARIRGGF